MWIVVGILLVVIALLIYFNEGGKATIEAFIVLSLFNLFILLDLWMISAVIIIVWGYNKMIKVRR